MGKNSIFQGVFLIVFFSINCYAQNSDELYNELKVLLNNKENYEKNWKICDDDYNKKDTLYFSTQLLKDSCGEWIVWNFYSKRKLTINSIKYVKGTHASLEAKPLSKSDFFNFKIDKIKEEVFIAICQNRNPKSIQKFKVLNIKNDLNEGKLITLVKEKK